MKNIILCLAVSLCNTGAFAGSFNELQSAAGGPGVMEERIPVFETPKASLADKQYDYNFRCIAGPSTPQYIAPTCYLYTARGQQACQSAGCNWAIGGTPLPSFHCAAASFTPQYVAPTCYLYTGRGQQACVNAGCSWTFGAKAVNRGCNQSGTVDPYCGAGNWRCYAEVNGTNIYGGCASSMSDCWSGGSGAVNPCR